MKQNDQKKKKKIANFTDKGSSTRQGARKPHHWPFSLNRNSRNRFRLSELCMQLQKGIFLSFEINGATFINAKK